MTSSRKITEDLQKKTGYDRVAAIEKCRRKAGRKPKADAGIGEDALVLYAVGKAFLFLTGIFTYFCHVSFINMLFISLFYWINKDFRDIERINEQITLRSFS